MTGRRFSSAAAVFGAALAARALPATAAPAMVAPSAAGGGRADGAARFVLSVGVNHSPDTGLTALRYADDDAVQYADLFRALGGKVQLLTRIDPDTRQLVAPEVVAVAREPRRAELTRAVAALASDVAAARARGQRTMLYFIYAGHGNVDGKLAYLALEDARLDANDIEHEIIDKVHADESHLIIDACYSNLVVRGPGGRRRDVPDFVGTLGLARRPDVGLLLSTTATHESHEWVGFQAGIFSHEVRSGLYGAADLDGDGRITYLEIASFVKRANKAIPNERFRPEVYQKAPMAAAQLVDLRGASGRRLRLDANARDDHYLFEDALGRRLADFHNARGHELSVLLPGGGRDLYLKRVGADETEFVIPPTPEVVSLADLSPQEPRLLSEGGADQLFRFAFSLPFDEEAVVEYVRSAPDVDVVADDTAPLPLSRKIAAAAAFGVGAGAGLLAISFGTSASQLQRQASNPLTPQIDTAALNERTANRRHLAELSIGVASAAVLTGVWLVFAPRAPVRPAGALDGASGTLGLAGDF
jgi:hypothetical protein